MNNLQNASTDINTSSTDSSNLGVISDSTGGTTTFIQDSLAESYTFPSVSDLDSDLIKAQVITKTQDIKEFLKRPIVLRQGAITTSSSGVIHAIDLPYEALHNTVYTPKVMGFLCFRATTVVTLQVNASRFCQGRLMMAFIPQAQVVGVMPGNRLLNLMTQTSLPNVQLDLATQREATLRIPFVNPKLYYDLTTGNGPIGAVYMLVYAPMFKGTGSTDPDYTIWVHFEDVELEVPAVPGNYLLQSGFAKSVKMKNQTDKELGKDSSALSSSNLSLVVGTVQKLIPSLSSFSMRPSWVLNTLGNVCKAFGFSNPTNEARPEVFRPSKTTFQSHSDRGNNADKLSYFSSNKVETLVGIGGTDQDEASISYIASKYAVWSSFQMVTTNVAGTSLAFIDIKANTFRSLLLSVSDGTSTWNYRTYTPIGYLMHYFLYWRGSIKLKLHFVKTEFHSGKILIYWKPTPNIPAPTTPTLNETNYLLRDIVDLSICVEYEFIVPFSNNSPWMHGEEVLGRVGFLVLNPLQAPDTVNNSIQIYVEVCGGDDFEVACPSPQNTQYQNMPLVVSNAAFVSQSGATDKRSVIGGSNVPNNQMTSTRFCIGESVRSVYSIIKRHNICLPFNLPKLTVGNVFRPFDVTYMGRGWNQADFSIPFLISDTFSSFACAYAYSRGSAGIRVVDASDTNKYVYQIIVDIRTVRPFYSPTASVTGIWHHTLTSSDRSDNAGGYEVLLPMYNELPMFLNRPNTCNIDPDFCPPDDEYQSKFALQVMATGEVPLEGVVSGRVFRFVGDDYQLGMFLGFPPIYSLN